MKRKKRHPITLLEIMIVILLIGVIGGVLSYNLKGTLDRGKQFKTDEGKKRLKEILDLEIERGPFTKELLTGKESLKNLRACVEASGFISADKIDSFLKDGWGVPYIVSIDDTTKELVVSQSLPSK